MKKVLYLLMFLAISACQVFGQDVIRNEKISEVKRVGDRVWFIKEIVSDSLICLPGAESKCLVGTNTIRTAEVFTLKRNELKELSNNELMQLYIYGTVDKKMRGRVVVLEEATFSTGCFMDKIETSFRKPSIDNKTHMIFLKEVREVSLSLNYAVSGGVALLLFLMINLFIRVWCDDIGVNIQKDMLHLTVGFFCMLFVGINFFSIHWYLLAPLVLVLLARFIMRVWRGRYLMILILLEILGCGAILFWYAGIYPLMYVLPVILFWVICAFTPSGLEILTDEIQTIKKWFSKPKKVMA